MEAFFFSDFADMKENLNIAVFVHFDEEGGFWGGGLAEVVMESLVDGI